MTAPTQRPNFLLIWIGILILVMTLGMRALVPGASLRQAAEANGAAPAAPAVLDAEPAPPPAGDAILPAEPLVSPLVDPNRLVEGASSLPGLMPGGIEGPAQTDAQTAVLAGLAGAGQAEPPLPQTPTELGRVEPAPLLSGFRPRPARAEVTSAAAASRSSGTATGSSALLVSFQHAADSALGADGAPAGLGEPVSSDEALIVEVAPDRFLTVVVIEEAEVGSGSDAEESQAEESGADSGSDSDSDSDGDGGSARRDGPETRLWLTELRDRLLNRAERGELSTEELRRFREEVARCWNSQDPAERRLLVLDLNRREVTSLLAQLAGRAQRAD